MWAIVTYKETPISAQQYEAFFQGFREIRVLFLRRPCNQRPSRYGKPLKPLKYFDGLGGFEERLDLPVPLHLPLPNCLSFPQRKSNIFEFCKFPLEKIHFFEVFKLPLDKIDTTPPQGAKSSDNYHYIFFGSFPKMASK